MKWYDRIDDGLLRAADATVLWLWDVIGVSYRDQIIGLTAVLATTMAVFVHSAFPHFGPGWLILLIGWVIIGFQCLMLTVLPGDALNALRIKSRKRPLDVFTRLPILVLGLWWSVAVHDPLGSAYWTVYFLWSLWCDAIIPTKPRRKRRIKLPSLAAPALTPLRASA